MENNLHYEFKSVCVYLFERTAQEVDQRIITLGLRHKDIVDKKKTTGTNERRKEAERKQDERARTLVSRVRNNKRYKPNRYLITPAVMEDLQKKLLFEDIHELHWGKDEIIRGYAEDVFIQIAMNILENYHDEYPALHQALTDYVPYAKWTVYLDVSFDHPDEMKYLLGYTQEELFSNVINAREQAISRLYRMSHPTEEMTSFGDAFTDLFIAFTHKLDKKGNKGFYKLDERIQGFVAEELSSLLEVYKPSDKSLGRRAHMLMKDDIPQELDDIQRDFQNQEDWNLFIDETNPVGLQRELLLESQRYVERLEEIQEKLDHDWKDEIENFKCE